MDAVWIFATIITNKLNSIRSENISSWYEGTGSLENAILHKLILWEYREILYSNEKQSDLYLPLLTYFFILLQFYCTEDEVLGNIAGNEKHRMRKICFTFWNIDFFFTGLYIYIFFWLKLIFSSMYISLYCNTDR